LPHERIKVVALLVTHGIKTNASRQKSLGIATCTSVSPALPFVVWHYFHLNHSECPKELVKYGIALAIQIVVALLFRHYS
jgi:hypothetical protein